MTYPEATRQAIREAYARSVNGQARQIDQVVLILSDGHWHSARELAIKVGHRFGGRIFELERAGVAIERERDPETPAGKNWWRYRFAREGQERLF
jgi:hypothetical protein